MSVEVHVGSTRRKEAALAAALAVWGSSSALAATRLCKGRGHGMACPDGVEVGAAAPLTLDVATGGAASTASVATDGAALANWRERLGGGSATANVATDGAAFANGGA